MRLQDEEHNTLTNILNIDLKVSERNFIDEEAKEKENSINEKMNELKISGEALISSPSQERIQSFLGDIENIDNAIKSVGDKRKKEQMREELCILARGIARDLYYSNKSNNVGYVYKIVSELSPRFSDTTLSSKLTMDVLKLKTILDRNSMEYRKQKEEKERKEKRKKMWKNLFILLISGAIIYWAVKGSSTNNNSTNATNITNSGTKTNTPMATATPKPMFVYNGKMFITPEYECVSPFTVIADSNTDYYIYLKYQWAPTNTTEKRSIKSKATYPYESDIAFYLKAGQTVSIDVPIGVYKLYYATGSTFFDTKLLFGSSTRCFDSDDLLKFYADSEYYQGHTITLKPVSYGNFDTDPINKSEFPTR